MLTRRRRSMILLLSPLAISAACVTVDVPFLPQDDASGGSAGSGPEDTGGTVSSSGGVEGGGGSTVGGSGGSLGGGFQGFGAAGGMGGYVGDLLVSAGSVIRDVATNASHVYFVEYGTFDNLDNYQFDGALRRIELDSGDVETIADGLEGPLEVEITTDEAFILLDRSTTVSPDGDRAVGRIALDGGPFGLVEHEGPYDLPFNVACFEDRAYFGVRVEGTWAVREYLPEQSGRVILPFEPSTFPGNQMAVDQTHLYFSAVGNWRQILSADADAEKLSSANYVNFTLEGERLLATRGQSPMYLASMPKDGGAWSNVLRLGDHKECTGLFVRGQRFFTECTPSSGSSYVLTGLWSGGNPKGYKLTGVGAWSGTEEALFIADDTELFRLALDPSDITPE